MVASALVSWVWGWAAPDMFDSSPDPEAGSSPEWTRAIDHRRRFGHDVVGVREYEGQLVAVIAVDGWPTHRRGGISARRCRRLLCRWRRWRRCCASSISAVNRFVLMV
jgi:hypothetical protein